MPTPYSAVPPHYVKTFTEYLRAAGYYCTNNKKTDYQFTPPFTAWDECNDHAHWRNRPEGGQPFFSVFNPTITHESGMWPRDDRPLMTDPSQVKLPPYLPNTPKAREALARHYDNLARADERVGEILRELEEDGLAENTIVFLWSDHGEGLPRGKRWPYDAGIRIPLIVRWPGRLEPGSVCDDLVSLIDLGPTVLSLCDVELPRHLQGQPFLGPQAVPRAYIFASRDRHDEAYDMVRAVRDKRYKYIRNFHPELPYLLWIPYRNRHPVVQEMWRLYAEGKLEGPQKLMFQTRRPPEEPMKLIISRTTRRAVQRLNECGRRSMIGAKNSAIWETSPKRKWSPRRRRAAFNPKPPRLCLSRLRNRTPALKLRPLAARSPRR
jgi:arylsulfatase A-like enzyme